MILQIMNQKEWINDQLEILNEEYKIRPISITQKEEILIWIDETDLIQVLTENFDYEAELSETIDFTNEEFAKQFIELFQKLKSEIVDRFYNETLGLGAC